MRSRLPAAKFLALFLAAAGIAAAASPSELERAIRQNGLDPAECYRVRDLSFAKEDVRVYLNDGYLIFTKPVEGRRTAALFSADVEGGDGEVILLPPTRSERQSLARFATLPNLDEHLRSGFFVFADGTAEELIQQIGAEGTGKKATEMGALLASQWSPMAANIEGPMALRLVQDVLAPAKPGRGLTFLALSGKTLGSFDVIVEPRYGARVEIRRRTERDNKPAYDVWTSFPARSARVSPGAPPRPEFSFVSYRIDASLDNDLYWKATTQAVLRVGAEPCRTPRHADRAIHADRGRAPSTARRSSGCAAIPSTTRLAIDDDESAVLVVPAQALAAGSEHTIEVRARRQRRQSGRRGRIFRSGPRQLVLPHTGVGGTTFDVTFRYPKRLTLVNAGELVSDRTEGDSWITRRRILVAVSSAGFNLGDYEKVSASGERRFHRRVRQSAPRRLAEAAGRSHPASAAAGNTPRARALRPRALVLPSERADCTFPIRSQGLKAVAADVSAAVDFYSGLFGPPALKTLTVAPIPGTFGQGFPGLLYLSTFAYLDPFGSGQPRCAPRQPAGVLLRHSGSARNRASVVGRGDHRRTRRGLLAAGGSGQLFGAAVVGKRRKASRKPYPCCRVIARSCWRITAVRTRPNRRGPSCGAIAFLTSGYPGRVAGRHLRQGRVDSAYAAPAHGRRKIPGDAGRAPQAL